MSVQAAERALRKPITIPRPERTLSPEAAREQAEAESVPIAEAVEMFAAQGRVRKAPPRPPVEVGA